MISVKQSNFKTIEAELFNYHRSKLELMEYVETLQTLTFPARSLDGCGAPTTGNISDPTGNRAVKLADSETALVMKEMSRRVEAIKWAYGMLPNGHKKLMEFYYWSGKHYTPEAIADKLHITTRTFSRWRKQIIYKIAMRLGWKI